MKGRSLQIRHSDPAVRRLLGPLAMEVAALVQALRHLTGSLTLMIDCRSSRRLTIRVVHRSAVQFNPHRSQSIFIPQSRLVYRRKVPLRTKQSIRQD
ncbi:protein of unknown function [Methylorubrum extorquens DM4]|uniref:Uncharacterized protein n=1 Tax=Methylorubrum extorquens (strain DSM 6343 / CIP 106787 / DM4) TaxID=661410 RepID=C7C9N5_METED|nr:protein of unknown function [Methylorubrum extorquens DM4]